MERINHTALLGNMFVYFRERLRHCVDSEASILARDGRVVYLNLPSAKSKLPFLIIFWYGRQNQQAVMTEVETASLDPIRAALSIYRVRASMGNKKEQTFQPRCQGPALCLWSVGQGG
jgi:hypothetical protein